MDAWQSMMKTDAADPSRPKTNSTLIPFLRLHRLPRQISQTTPMASRPTSPCFPLTRIPRLPVHPTPDQPRRIRVRMKSSPCSTQTLVERMPPILPTLRQRQWPHHVLSARLHYPPCAFPAQRQAQVQGQVPRMVQAQVPTRARQGYPRPRHQDISQHLPPAPSRRLTRRSCRALTRKMRRLRTSGRC